MPAERKTIYLIGGTDEFTIKQRAAELAGKLAPKAAGEFGVETLEGEINNMDDALRVLNRLHEALNTVGFFGAEKLVWLKSTTLLADNRTTQTETVKDALVALADSLKRGLPPGVTLLISAIGCDQRRGLFLTIKKLGDVAILQAPEAGKPAGDEEIDAFLRERLQAAGKRMTHDAVATFRQMVEPSLREIASELEKLCLYVRDRPEISVADVRAICSASRQAIIWELTEAIGARNLPRAIGATENLLANGEAAIGMVVMLAQQFRLMLLARDLADRRVLIPGARGFDYVERYKHLPEAETGHFPRTKEGQPPNPWRVYHCAVAARNFSQAELIRALDRLLEAQTQLVSTGLDERLVIEEALTKIARKAA